MNQTIFLLLAVLGIAGVGSLISGNDDDHPPEDPADDPFGGRDLTEGTEEDDTITGGDGDDAIQSYAGDDVVSGGAGNDLIWTGRGEDHVAADPGNDEIYLGYDDDVYGTDDHGTFEGNDTIDGGEGNDTIITQLGNHSVTGGGGDDRIEDRGGFVHIDGEEGNDLILSTDASDPDHPDILLGGNGNDTIHAGAYDAVDGGDGADQIVLRSDNDGPVSLIYGGSDNMVITLARGYTGAARYDLVQDGEDVRLVVNNEVLAILRNVDAENVANISFVRET